MLSGFLGGQIRAGCINHVFYSVVSPFEIAGVAVVEDRDHSVVHGKSGIVNDFNRKMIGVFMDAIIPEISGDVLYIETRGINSGNLDSWVINELEKKGLTNTAEPVDTDKKRHCVLYIVLASFYMFLQKIDYSCVVLWVAV